ncbi:MAG: zinc ribbon domain-containing protein [bacterium]|nr:zinc ribbon domain-containing protein [bacterium]
MKKLKELLLSGAKLAAYYEENSRFEPAYNEYLKINNHIKAGEMLQKTGKWHDAAALYVKNNETELARKAMDNCFRLEECWGIFELDNGNEISIETWLKQKHQTQQFVRSIKYVEILDEEGIPRVVHLANKLKQVMEYKSAADLYRNGFQLVNKEKEAKSISNEKWLRNAAECLSKAKLYSDAAECMKELIITEVKIGEAVSKSGHNPYREYTHNLKAAKELNVLPRLIEILEDFDPFNLSYDLLRISEPELSMDMFFRYYGKLLKKKCSDQEMDERNKRVQYCLNQYVVYYSRKGQYKRAAEVALLNSQKEIAADLFKKAAREEENQKSNATGEPLTEVETVRCPTCGEFVQPDWETCPGCKNVLYLNMCACGQKLKSTWAKCPACQRAVEPAANREKEAIAKAGISKDEDTRPFKIFSE